MGWEVYVFIGDTHTQRRIQSNPLEFEASWCRKTTSETTQTSAASALILTGTAAITTIKADQRTHTHAHQKSRQCFRFWTTQLRQHCRSWPTHTHTHIVASKVFFNTGEVELYKYTATTAHISRSSSTLAVLCADRTYDLNITLNDWWWWGMCKQ